MARAAACSRNVENCACARAGRAFVEVIERHGVGVADEWRRWPRKCGRVASDVRQAQLVQPAAERGILGAGVVLLGAQHDERIGGIIRGAAVAITGVAADALCRTDELPIDVEPHGAAQCPHGGDVTPCPIVHALAAADGGSGGAHRDAEDEPAASQRNSEVAVVACAEDVAIEDDVAVNPAVVFIAARHAIVFSGQGAHPKLDGEVGGADVRRALRRVDGNQHAIEPWRAHAGAVETQRIAGCLCMEVRFLFKERQCDPRSTQQSKASDDER